MYTFQASVEIETDRQTDRRKEIQRQIVDSMGEVSEDVFIVCCLNNTC